MTSITSEYDARTPATTSPSRPRQRRRRPGSSAAGRGGGGRRRSRSPRRSRSRSRPGSRSHGSLAPPRAVRAGPRVPAVGTLHPMRALLVVNPTATTTSARTRDVLAHALASDLKLEVATTEYRGHARDLARQAAESGSVDLVVALGGDGTVNEVVNGLLHEGPDPDRLPRPRGGPRRQHQCLRPRPGPAQRRGGGDRRAAGRAGGGQRADHRPGPGGGTPGTEDDGVPARWFTFCAGLGIRRRRGRPGGAAARARKAFHTRSLRPPGRCGNSSANRHRRHGTITLRRPGRGAGRRSSRCR